MIEIPDLVEHFSLSGEIAESLIVVTELKVVSIMQIAGDRRKLSGKRLEYRRFARTVRTHDGVAFSSANGERQIPDRGLSLVADGQVLGGQRNDARPRPGVEREPSQRFIRLRPGQLVQPLQHVAPRLGLLRLLSGDVATDEILRLLDELLLPLVLDPHPFVALAALLDESIVVAVVFENLSMSQFDDLTHRTIQKRSIVRNDQVASAIRLQKLFQKLDSMEI